MHFASSTGRMIDGAIGYLLIEQRHPRGRDARLLPRFTFVLAHRRILDHPSLAWIIEISPAEEGVSP